jgi:hypothetical protein
MKSIDLVKGDIVEFYPHPNYAEVGTVVSIAYPYFNVRAKSGLYYIHAKDLIDKLVQKPVEYDRIDIETV